MDDQPAINKDSPDLTCPFCHVPLVLVVASRRYDCSKCKTFSRFIGEPAEMNDMTNDTPPRRVYLQWYGDPDDGTDPIGDDRPEGVTFHEARVYRNDICYIRAGRHTGEALREQDEEIAALKAENVRLRAELKLALGAIAAQDERNLAATNATNMTPVGCDTPDALADEILALRADLATAVAQQ